MMIQIQLLSFPKIEEDGVLIRFPYKKAEALFYYLAVEKSISRDKAALLLWEDEDELTAKKNLRHAIYIIRKMFHDEVVISPQKSMLQLNPSAAVSTDLESLDGSADGSLPAYDEFLKDFSVKNAENYTQWLEEKRALYSGRYLNAIYQHMQSDALETEQAEELFERYTTLDAFDERIYMALMGIYQKKELFHKGVQLYQKLQQLLEEEFGIAPSKAASDLYHVLLNHWLDASAEPETVPQPPTEPAVPNAAPEMLRSDLLNQLRTAYAAMQNVLITGEHGAGKSYLVRQFLTEIPQDTTLVLAATCFLAEKNMPLQSWNDIIFQIDSAIQMQQISLQQSFINSVAQFFPTFGSVMAEDIPLTDDLSKSFRYRSCKNSILRIITQLAATKRLVFYFDNINAMDAMGQELVSSIIRLRNPNIFFVLTSLPTADYDTITFFSSLSKEGLLLPLRMERLTLEESARYLQAHVFHADFTPEMLEKIYAETQGNFFFLSEMAANLREQKNISFLSLSARGILDDRLNGLSPSARALLDTISVFHDFATFNTLTMIHEQDSVELLSDLEELKEHALIQEKSEKGKPHITFVHSKMRLYIYEKLSPSRRRILHNKVAEALELRLKTDMDMPSLKAILFHYQHARNREKCLCYEIWNIEAYSGLNYELYPVLDATGGETATPSSNVLHYFEHIENDLLEYHRLNPDFAQFHEFFARLMHAKSRYCILTGNYTEGKKCLDSGLSDPYSKQNAAFLLRFMRQSAYYALQLHDTELLDRCTKDGLMISQRTQNRLEHAFYHRLRGAYYIYTGDWEHAFTSLMQSVDYFSKTEMRTKPYTLNIAAVYNYLGEIKRRTGALTEAVLYYNKAIALCREQGCSIAPTFYTDLALTYFSAGDSKTAEQYFRMADTAYGNTLTLMGKPMVKAFLAYFRCQRQDSAYLEDWALAQEACQKLQNPVETGVLHLLAAKMAAVYPHDFPKRAADYQTEGEAILHCYPPYFQDCPETAPAPVMG